MFIYGRVGQPSHRDVYLTYMQYVQISSIIYERNNRSTKAGHENPQKNQQVEKGSGATLGVLGYASA